MSTPSALQHSAQLGMQSRHLYAGRTLSPRCSLLLEAEWTQAAKCGLETFQGHCRESNPEPPILWHSASTNCAAPHSQYSFIIHRTSSSGSVRCRLSWCKSYVSLRKGLVVCCCVHGNEHAGCMTFRGAIIISSRWSLFHGVIRSKYSSISTHRLV